MKSLQHRLSTRSQTEIWLLAYVDRWRWLLLVLPILVSIAGYNGMWRIRPDGVRHMHRAEAMLSDRHVDEFPKVSMEKPGLAAILAFNMERLGKEKFYYAQLIMLGIGWASLILVYLLFWLYDGRPLAVLMFFMMGMTEHFVMYQYELLTELPFMMGMLLMLVGWQWIQGRRKDHLLSGRQARAWLKIEDHEEEAPAEAADEDPNQDPDEEEEKSPHSISANWMLSPEANLVCHMGRWAIGLIFLFSGIALMWYFRSVYLVAVMALVVALGCVCLRGLIRGPRRGRWALGLIAWATSMLVGVTGFLLGTGKGRQMWQAQASEGTDAQMAGGAIREMLSMIREGRLTGEIGNRIAENIPHLFTEALAESVLGADLGPYLFVVVTLLILLSVSTLYWRQPLMFMLVLLYILQQIPFWVTDRYMLPILVIYLFAWWHLLSTWPVMVNRVMNFITAWPTRGGVLFEESCGVEGATSLKWHRRLRGLWRSWTGSKPAIILFRAVAGFALLFWMIPNVIQTVELLIEQQEAPFYEHYRGGRFLAPYEASRKLNEEAAQGATIIIDRVYAVNDEGFYRDLLRRNIMAFLTDQRIQFSDANVNLLNEAGAYYLHRIPGDDSLPLPVDITIWKKIGAWPGEKGTKDAEGVERRDEWTLYQLQETVIPAQEPKG